MGPGSNQLDCIIPKSIPACLSSWLSIQLQLAQVPRGGGGRGTWDRQHRRNTDIFSRHAGVNLGKPNFSWGWKWWGTWQRRWWSGIMELHTFSLKVMSLVYTRACVCNAESHKLQKITARNKKKIRMVGNVSSKWLPRDPESLPLMAFKTQMHKALFCTTWLWNNFSDGNQPDHLQRSLPIHIVLDYSISIPKANPNPNAATAKGQLHHSRIHRTFPLPKTESISKSNNYLNLLQFCIFNPDYSC